jgi:hypothetical protein
MSREPPLRSAQSGPKQLTAPLPYRALSSSASDASRPTMASTDPTQ